MQDSLAIHFNGLGKLYDGKEGSDPIPQPADTKNVEKGERF